MKKAVLTFLCMFSLICVNAQMIKGKILDQNGEALAFASVFVNPGLRGTASNADGKYILGLPQGKYNLKVQYLGYQTFSKEIDVKSGTLQLDITLKEEPLLLETIEVNSEMEDPAYTIMRRAIAKAKFHQQHIDKYTVTAYLKGSGRLKKVPGLFRKKIERELAKEGVDTSTAFVTESVNEIIYTRPNQYDEKVISIRSVGNDNNTSPNRFILSSFYYDNVGPVISPLSQKSFAYYKFEYLGFFSEGDQLINKIKVTPRRPGDNIFSGIIYIVDQAWSIHSLDLNTSIWGIKFRIKQIYQAQNETSWMPVNQEFLVDGRILGFGFEYQYFVNMKDYQITLNPDLIFVPEILDNKLQKEEAKKIDLAIRKKKESTLETLVKEDKISGKMLRKILKDYEKEEKEEIRVDSVKDVVSIRNFEIDSAAHKRDSAFWAEVRPIPLTDYEVKGYNRVDSLAIASEIENKEDSMVVSSDVQKTISVKRRSDFKLSHFVFGGRYKLGKHSTFGLTSMVERTGFNVVEGLSLGNKVFFTSGKNNTMTTLSFSPSYNFGRNKLDYFSDHDFSWGSRKYRSSIGIQGGTSSFPINAEGGIHPVFNAFYTILFHENYMLLYQKDFGKISYNIQTGSKIILF
jgi:hypothetical protein